MDHFSEAEAQRIFADAARASAATPPEGGLSLDELREIGRAAGLDPDAVTAAAAALRDAPPDIPMWGTTPLATRRTRTVAGQLSDDAWADAVAGLRREFKAQGVAERIGRTRTWTYAVGPASELLVARLTAEPVGDSTRITLESGEGSEKRAARITGSIMAVIGVVFAAIGVFNGNLGAATAFAILFAVLGMLIYGGLRSAVVWQARVRPARFDTVLDRIARLAATRDSPSASVGLTDPVLDAVARTAPEVPLPVGLLDLDGPLTVEDPTPSAPRRARS